LTATDTDFAVTAGEGEPAVTVSAPEFELFRALTGRRSTDQVAAFDWTGDRGGYLERFNIFGVVRTEPVTD
jgi:hypothetical protein